MTSPCVGVCRLEADVCAGCRRTIAEIAAWSTMTAAERDAVAARLASARNPREGALPSIIEGDRHGSAAVRGL